MRVHHISCGTLCPFGGRLIAGTGPVLSAARMVCHCLLVETPSSGLVLVDTGMGTADLADLTGRMGREFTLFVRPRRDPAQTAVAQVRRLGFSPDDVRHIVVTHLDLDHAGGLPDFPAAEVHVYAPELAAALARSRARDRRRYRPHQWAHGPRWQTYERPGEGERWFGFECVRELRGLPPEILMVPLIGHTRGHCGVAVREGGSDWLLHAGDAYFHHGEMDPVRPHCTPMLSLFQRVMETERAARLANQDRLRALVRDHGREVRVFSAHDVLELERCQALSRPQGAALPAA